MLPAKITHGRSILRHIACMLLCASPFFALHARAASTLCAVSGYKILSPNSIALNCGDAITVGLTATAGALYLGTDLSTLLPVNVKVQPYPYSSNWLYVLLTPKTGSSTAPVLKGNTKYTLTLTLSQTTAATTVSFPTATQIDTTANLTITTIPIGGPNNYEATSSLALQGLGLGTGGAQKCDLTIEHYTGTFETRHATCRQMQATLVPGFPDPGTVGELEFRTHGNDIATQGIPYQIVGLQNVLGTTMTLAPTSRLGQNRAPATKDASSYYLNGSYAAGRGARPGWVIDAKIAPPIGPMPLGLLLTPSFTANIGQNSVSGLAYTDTIDFSFSGARPIVIGKTLNEIYSTAGITYETDREFNRDNLLAVTDFRFNFKHLYGPQSVRTLREFSAQQAIAKSHGITLQPSDVPPAFLGYQLDFHLGTETGGALADTTVNATVGTASINLPAYNIVRIVPEVHGLLQLGRLSIDATATPRYLAATENTTFQLPNNTLILRTVHGWNAYGVVTSAINLDPSGHFSFSVSYRNGFAPPRFQRINAVQTGILLKF